MTKFNAPQYLQLNKGGSMARMSILCMKAHAHSEPRPPSMAQDWRKARKYGFHNWASAFADMSGGMQGEGFAREPVWYTHTGEYFRNERDCNEIEGMRQTIGHTGWFTDTDQNEKAVGIVGMLTHGRFIAGYRWTANDERVYFGQVYDNDHDAAIAADGHAESFAEFSRDDAEKWDAARDCESEIEDSLIRLRECIGLRHKECMDYVRDEIAELIESIRTNRERMADEFKNYA